MGCDCRARATLQTAPHSGAGPPQSRPNGCAVPHSLCLLLSTDRIRQLVQRHQLILVSEQLQESRPLRRVSVAKECSDTITTVLLGRRREDEGKKVLLFH